MKIAIFSDAFYPQINGIVTSIMSIAENMTVRGHEVIIVAPRYGKKEVFQHPKIKVKRVASIPANFYEDFRWTTTLSYPTYKYLRNEKIDLVHFMTPFFTSYLGIKFGRLLGVPVVGTFHTFISNPSYFKHLINGPISVSEEAVWGYCNKYYDAADYATAPTKKAVEIIKANGCTVPMEPLSNGIDLNIFDNSHAAEFKVKYGLKNQVILFVGRVAHEKSLKVLIDAYTLVKEDVPEAQLLIVGDGPQMEEFSKHAYSNHSKEEVIFTGAISHDNLMKSGIFSLVSLFATPSVTETQGITILEAQANGLISIGVTEGGVVDLILNEENGFLVEPENPEAMAEKISFALLNRSSLSYMEENAREMARIHDLTKVIDRWEEIYSELIRKKAAGEIQDRDYLHFRTLASIIMDFKIDKEYFRVLFSNNRAGPSS